jgi:DNA-binding transcriptional ArsR family regulator
MRVELTGIHIEGKFVWDIFDYELFQLLRALPSLVPIDAVVYLEGCGINNEVGQFLLANPAPFTTKVYPGTIAPVPQIFHIPASPNVLSALSRLVEHSHSYEFCDHLHVYQSNTVLLQGHDFGDLPLMLAEQFSEQQVSDFCQNIGARFEKRQINTR